MNLDELKNYLRVDSSYDDSLLLLLQDAAESYLRNAIESEKAEEDVRFKLATALIVGTWYANRENDSSSSLSSLPLGVQSIISQLRGV